MRRRIAKKKCGEIYNYDKACAKVETEATLSLAKKNVKKLVYITVTNKHSKRL